MLRKTILIAAILILLMSPALAEPPGFKNYSQYSDFSTIDLTVVGLLEWFFDIMNSKTGSIFTVALILAPMLTIYIKSESIDVVYIMICIASSLIGIYFSATFSNIIYWLLVIPLAVSIYKVLIGR